MIASIAWRAPAIAAFAMCAAAAIVHANSPADASAAPPPGAVVEQPRAFGYVVGDVMAQRVLLQLNGRAFEPAALPRAERVSAWQPDPKAADRQWGWIEQPHA